MSSRFLEKREKRSVLKKQYAGAIALVCATVVLASCSNLDVADTPSNVAVTKSEEGKLANIDSDKDYTEVMRTRGNEDIVNTWMNIIYADEEKVIVVANDGILFVYDYEQNKVVRYISLKDYGINGGLEGDEDVLHMIVDKNCRYIYINEWGTQKDTLENVTLGKYRYDINKNSIEKYEFEEKEIDEWISEEAEDAENVSITGKTIDGIVYGVSTENTDQEIWQHNKEQIVISKDGKAMKYFPFEPGRESETIIIKY